MLFNSIDFLIFLPLVFIAYHGFFNRSLNARNYFLVIVSYIFYGWWDYRFLALILISSLTDYYAGLLIQNNTAKKKKLGLWLSLLVNLGFLGFFKYYNFFVDSFIEAFSFAGISFNARSLNVILPVGISFYTFQTLSYTLDVYAGRLKATTNPGAFLAYVSFFPQLVAGPIERAGRFLPQFYKLHRFDQQLAFSGLRLMLWGFFKKVVIADNAAQIVEKCFNHTGSFPSLNLWLGIVFFAFQIYGDFSGYTDIAIGTARLFGLQLMRNFNFPYFSKSFPDFWKRWHISLSEWLRDYLFLPLAYKVSRKFVSPRTLGIKAEIWIYSIAITVTWFLGGLWHGAKWTFVLWGTIHGVYLLINHATTKAIRRLKKKTAGIIPKPLLQFLTGLWIFCLVCLAWVMFRADSFSQALIYYRELFAFDDSKFIIYNADLIKNSLILILFVVYEWSRRNTEDVLYYPGKSRIFRWLVYLLLIYAILFLGNFNEVEFIYFQF